MKVVIRSIFLILFLGRAICLMEDRSYPHILWNPRRGNCDVGPRGRAPWILHVRNSDYGWKDETHRANIALAVNGYEGETDEMRKMDLQLEVEVTKALFRNSTLRIHYNDIAFFVHGLIAKGKNPRNFHGVDLVADLLHHVHYSESGQVHPFVVLALCNAHAVKFDHLMKIRSFLSHDHDKITNSDVDDRKAQLKAIAVKAFACAGTIDKELKKFSDEIDKAINCLLKMHNKTEGSFGNVYTTSLAVQALIAREATSRNKSYDWKKQNSLEYLEKEAFIDVNLIKAYYIEMALNADKVNFIKDLYKGGSFETPGTLSSEDSHYVTYSLKKGLYPEIYHSVTIKVPRRLNFYEIMLIIAKENNEFRFSAYNDVSGLPKVYKISGIPNDPEENLFWRICRGENHSRRTSFNDSPSNLIPEKDESITLWYRNAECPLK